jgi:heat shock protein HspQ
MINLSEPYAIPPDSAKFSSGQVVRHIRYGYRGLIVDFDPTCQADDEWYKANKTQPNKNQPWYHVLVDGQQQVTYVAQDNLEFDSTGDPIVHPMLNLFFSGHDESTNRYLRNEVPWNPGQPPDAPPPPPPEPPEQLA